MAEQLTIYGEPFGSAQDKRSRTMGMAGVSFNVGEGAVLAATRLIDSVRVKTVCDTNPETMKSVAEKYGVPNTTPDWRTMLEDEEIDIIYFGTPAQFHAQQARAALQAGKHVYIEKPIAQDLKQACEIAQLADKSGLKILVGMNERAKPQFRAIKRLQEMGEFGEVFFLQWDYIHDQRWCYKSDSPRFTPWRADTNFPMNAFLEVACHPVDMLLWFGGEVEEVYAMQSVGAVPEAWPGDCISVQLRFAGGNCIGRVLHNIGMIGHAPREFHLYGTKGSVVPGEGELQIYLDRMNRNYMNWGSGPAVPYDLEADIEELTKDESSEYQHKYQYQKGDPSHVSGHLWLIPHLIKCIQENQRPLIDARENAHMMAVIMAAMKSLETNRPEKVERVND